MFASPRFRRRLARTIAGVLSVYIVCAAALTIWKLDGPLVQPYCSERPPFAQPLSPQQAVFTANVFYVGRVSRNYAAQSGHAVGLWALARVEHHYSGLPWWSSRIVFLANGGFEKGKSYFIDGDRSSFASHLAPLVHVGTCTRSVPLERADIDIRILRDGPPKLGVRIIGRVVRQPQGQSVEAVPGVKIEIKSPSGSMLVVSDEKGVYDASELPPGHYSLSVGQAAPGYLTLLPVARDLKAGDVWGRTLLVR